MGLGIFPLDSRLEHKVFEKENRWVIFKAIQDDQGHWYDISISADNLKTFESRPNLAYEIQQIVYGCLEALQEQEKVNQESLNSFLKEGDSSTANGGRLKAPDKINSSAYPPLKPPASHVYKTKIASQSAFDALKARPGTYEQLNKYHPTTDWTEASQKRATFRKSRKIKTVADGLDALRTSLNGGTVTVCPQDSSTDFSPGQ
ncbi:MAG: hypothetical protein HW387_672 [Parachlamydiales bacterium]|nr:hypothetical protein [Parachlamydiales bacterium]